MNKNCPICELLIEPRNRLITDSCGHIKCKQCFLKDELECSLCSRVKKINNINSKRIEGTNLEGTKHINKITSDNGEIQYECTICGKKFKNRSQLYYHRACADGNLKKYKCEQCEKHFISKSHLRYHNESHTKQTHVCNQCGKQFSKFTIYKKHQQLHKRLAQNCSFCGKVYRTKLSLAAHLSKVHNATETKTFQCQYCDKKCHLKTTLQQHMLKHFAKKFECHVCKKGFIRNSTLQSHLKRHNAQAQKFICQVCSSIFSDLGSLVRHGKKHKDNLQYKCRFCQISSIRKDNMLRHVRNIHEGTLFVDCVDIIHVKLTKANETETKENENEMEIEKIQLPKTVANSSVIKCVGNVEPMKIPDCRESPEPIDKNYNEAAIVHKKLKKKYDPIEMYRKILISDEDECEKTETIKENAENSSKSNEQKVLNDTTEQQQQQQRNHNITTSNFSETHWRKNFKFTYQHRE